MALMAPDSYHYLKHKDRPAFNCFVKSKTTINEGEKPTASPSTSLSGNDRDVSNRLPPLAVKSNSRGVSSSGTAPAPASSPKHWTEMTSPTAAVRQSCSDIPEERNSTSPSSSRFNLAEATARYARSGARLTVSMNGREAAIESPVAAMMRNDGSPKRVDVGQNQAVAIRESRAAMEGLQKLGMPKWEAEAFLESEKQRRHQMAVHLLLKQKFTF